MVTRRRRRDIISGVKGTGSFLKQYRDGEGTKYFMAVKPERNWERSDGVVINDEGENYVPCCFSSTGEANDHFSDHCVDYPGLT